MTLWRTSVAAFFLIVSSLVAPAYGMPPDPPVSIPDASTVFLLGSACVIGYVVLRKHGRKKKGKK